MQFILQINIEICSSGLQWIKYELKEIKYKENLQHDFDISHVLPIPVSSL